MALALSTPLHLHPAHDPWSPQSSMEPNCTFCSSSCVFISRFYSLHILCFNVLGDEMETDHFDFNDIFKDLPELRTFCVVYGVRDCGMNFEWNLFQFTTRDCLQLSKCIATTKHLTSFTITRSKVCSCTCMQKINEINSVWALWDKDCCDFFHLPTWLFSAQSQQN